MGNEKYTVQQMIEVPDTRGFRGFEVVSLADVEEGDRVAFHAENGDKVEGIVDTLENHLGTPNNSWIIIKVEKRNGRTIGSIEKVLSFIDGIFDDNMDKEMNYREYYFIDNKGRSKQGNLHRKIS